MFRVGSGEFLVVMFVAMLFLGPNQIKSLIKKWTEVLSIVRQTTQQLSEELQCRPIRHLSRSTKIADTPLVFSFQRWGGEMQNSCLILKSFIADKKVASSMTS